VCGVRVAAAVGPDGKLWVSIGDGGNSGDPGNRGQKLSTRKAKLLRINVDKRGAGWREDARGELDAAWPRLGRIYKISR
jgi:hypothetical protein